MTEYLIPFIERLAILALVWGPLIVLVLMAVESSFIPFPSEIVLIPAGFMASRSEFYPGDSLQFSLSIILIAGILGSLLGATINYCLSLWLGRPFLYRWGRYFFIKAENLKKAEDVFLKNGEITTFICRLVPVIRQLISIPAGLSRMNYFRFVLFTGLGASIWVMMLTYIGYYLGAHSEGMSYGELVYKGKEIISANLTWIILALVILSFIYFTLKRYLKTQSKSHT